MEINQLRAFLASCESVSFEKAAKEMGVTRQAISNAVRNCEAELGVQLFERKHNQMRLTAMGKKFAQRTHRVIRLVDDLYVDNAEGKDELILGLDTFTIGSMTDPFESLAEYACVENGCHVRIAQDFFETMEDMLLSGERDLLILRSLESELESCVAVPLRMAKLGFIVRKEDPLSNKETLNIEDVLDRNFILPNDAEQRYRALFSAISNLKKNNLKISYIDNSALALRAIKRTSGIGITDFEDRPQKIEIEGCFKIPLEGDFANVYDYAVYIENSPKRNQIEHFIGWLLEKDRFLRWCPSRPISDRTESTEI